MLGPTYSTGAAWWPQLHSGRRGRGTHGECGLCRCHGGSSPSSWAVSQRGPCMAAELQTKQGVWGRPSPFPLSLPPSTLPTSWDGIEGEFAQGPARAWLHRLPELCWEVRAF